MYSRKEVNMKVINFRLNPIDEATFTACKNYLVEQDEIYKSIGITRKVTNSDVIRAGLQLLFDQARKNKCNKKTD